MRAIRTLATPYARHTHAQRVCGFSGNGFCAQARQDRLSRRRERTLYLFLIVGLCTFMYGAHISMIVGLVGSRNNPLHITLGYLAEVQNLPPGYIIC